MKNTEQAIITQLLDKYNYLVNSQSRQKWLSNYTRILNYYFGIQWDKETLDRLEGQYGWSCKTINAINYKTKKILSILNKNSFRSGFIPLSSMKVHKKIAEDIKQWALNQQTQSNHQLYSQLKAKDALLGGIGCSTFRREKDKFVYEYIDPREMFWDPDDLTSRFENQKILMRVRFVHRDDLLLLYPDKEKEINELIQEEQKNAPPNISEWYNIPSQNWTVNGNSIRVAEIYQKKRQKYYTGTALLQDEDDNVIHTFKTFHKDIAEKYSKDEEGRFRPIEENEGTIIWRSVFTNNILFENDPIAEQVPNQKYFPYTFMFYDNNEGEPVGLMREALPIQDMLNQTITEYVQFRDAQLMMATTAVGQDPDVLSEAYAVERNKKNGLLLLTDPEKIKIVSSSQNVVDGYLNYIKYLQDELQRVTGIFDDYEGMQTNATSGVAIMNRAQLTINASSSIMRELRQSVISEGQLMLDTLKGIKEFEEIIQFYKKGQAKVSVLTEEISLLDFQVIPEPTTNFSTTVEEEKSIYLSILQDPNKDYILTTPSAMERLGLSEQTAYDISEEYKVYLSKQLMRSQGVNPWQDQNAQLQQMTQQQTQQQAN
jgi:hypothetical protein